MLKSFRYLLLPFSVLYGLVILIRNWLYDKRISKSATFNFPLICVGNLAVGGTGKTPMVEYIVELLQSKYNIATLSRGYKRKTKGFAIANENTTALQIGDEPMQFHQKYKNITVAVGEERLVAIPQILHDKPNTQVIILDDAFQHRAVQAGLNILLTEYKNLFTRDFMLPAGDLRDVRVSYKRAEIIVVTKCPANLSVEEKNKILAEIKPLPHQQVFFTTIEYSLPYHLFTRQFLSASPSTEVLLICGIANPRPIKEYLTSQMQTYDMLKYPDHHIFDMDDLKNIKNQFSKIKSSNKIILTTEKDAVRLLKFKKELNDFPIYAIPIKHRFLFNEGEQFNNTLIHFIESFTTQTSA